MALTIPVGVRAAPVERLTIPPGDIVVLGDSLSAGYELAPTDAWPHLIELRLRRDGYPHRVINASVSGSTSAAGVTRLPALLRRHRPVLTIVELGANDGLRGQPLARLYDNLNRIVDDARQSGGAVLLIGMKIPPSYGPSYADGFEQTYKRVAERGDIRLLPFLLEPVALRTDLLLADGLHPNRQGQVLLAEHVFKFLSANYEFVSPWQRPR